MKRRWLMAAFAAALASTALGRPVTVESSDLERLVQEYTQLTQEVQALRQQCVDDTTSETDPTPPNAGTDDDPIKDVVRSVFGELVERFGVEVQSRLQER